MRATCLARARAHSRPTPPRRRVEKEESALKKKLAIVLNDKQKIEDTISTLDIKKKEALHKTWEKVNAQFGAIFGDLLPSSSCKLDAPEGQEIRWGGRAPPGPSRRRLTGVCRPAPGRDARARQ